MGRRIGTLGLVNYKTHPTDNRYKIFNFNSKDEADYFESLLTEKGIWFEKDVEQLETNTPLYLFGINSNDFEKVQKANFLVSAKHRQPTIKNNFARYALVIFFIFIVTIGLIGYIKAQ